MTSLQLEIQLAATVSLRQLIAPDEGRVPFSDAEERCIIGYGQIFFVLI